MSDAYDISEAVEGQYEVQDGTRSFDWSSLPKDPNDGNWCRKHINRGGSVPVRGYIQAETLEVGIEIQVDQGPWLGPFYSNLKDGLRVSFNSDSINGSLNLYLRNGNEVWGNCNFENPQLEEGVKWLTF